MKFILHDEAQWNNFINSSREYDKRDTPPDSYPCLCIQTFASNPQGSDYRHDFVKLEEIEYGGATQYLVDESELW